MMRWLAERFGIALGDAVALNTARGVTVRTPATPSSVGLSRSTIPSPR